MSPCTPDDLRQPGCECRRVSGQPECRECQRHAADARVVEAADVWERGVAVALSDRACELVSAVRVRREAMKPQPRYVVAGPNNMSASAYPWSVEDRTAGLAMARCHTPEAAEKIAAALNAAEAA